MLHRRPQLAQPKFWISALRGSRNAASLSAVIAPFQFSATSSFLPAAKSGSSCAQSASDPIVPMVVQIGQSSSGIFASAFRSGAPSHAAMEPRHENSTAAGNSYCKCPTWKPDRTAAGSRLCRSRPKAAPPCIPAPPSPDLEGDLVILGGSGRKVERVPINRDLHTEAASVFGWTVVRGDFYDEDEICRAYYPEERLLKDATGADSVLAFNHR